MKRKIILAIGLILFSVLSFSQSLDGKFWSLQNPSTASDGVTLFCVGGYFTITTTSLDTGQGMGGFGGTYSLYGNTLKLTAENGQVLSYTLSWLSSTKFKLHNYNGDLIYAQSSSSDDNYAHDYLIAKKGKDKNNPGTVVNPPVYPPVVPQTSPTICAVCNKTGTCRVCEGKGRLPYTVGGVNPACTSCSGSGRCSYCNGTGIFQPKY